MRYCPAPGCTAIVDKGRCTEHTAAKQQHEDQRRGSAASRGYDRSWAQFREWNMRVRLFEEFEGKCQLCGYRFRLSSEVLWDHKVPLSKGGARLDPANVWPLCKACNTAKGDRIAKDGTEGYV